MTDAATRSRIGYWGVAAFLLAAGLALAGLSLPPVLFPNGGFFDSGLRLLRDEQELRTYFDRGQWLVEGGRPYSPEYPQEYPPVGVLFLSLPRLLASDPVVFQFIFAALTSLLFGVLVWLTGKILVFFGRPLKYLWLLLLPGVLYFSVWRFDVLPAVLVAAAVHALTAKRLGRAGLWLVLGGLVKFYPAFFLLPLLMLAASGWGASKPVPVRRGTIWAVLAVAAAGLGGVLWLAGPNAFLSPVLFHLGRGFEIGSLGDIVIWLANFAGGGSAGLAIILAAVFSALQFVPFIWLVAVGRITDPRGFIRACLFLLLPFMLLNRFISPQWVVWLIPLAILVSDARETAVLILLGAVAYLQFPVLFGLDPFAWHYKGASALLLAGFAWLAWRNAAAMKREGFIGRSASKTEAAGTGTL